MSAFETTTTEVRVPLGTRVVFTRHREEPHPTFEDVTRVIVADVAAVTVSDYETHGKHQGVVVTTRSAETVHLTAQEWVHPEDGEVV